MSSGRRQGGFTYLAALLLIVMVGAGLGSIGELWSQTQKRQKELELIWIGNQFRQAIGLYYERSPGTVKRYPEKLDDLLEDKRYIAVQRYIRRIYSDPMTGSPDWRLVPAPGGGFMGVSSLSNARALKRSPVAKPANVSSGSESYSAWVFTYEPVISAPDAATGRPATPK